MTCFSIHNLHRSRTLEIVSIDEKNGNTGIHGRYFWRIEANEGRKDSRLQCLEWSQQQNEGVRILSRFLNPCPCSLSQAFFDRRFRLSRVEWPNIYYFSNFVFSILPFYGRFEFVFLQKQCVYNIFNGIFGVLNVGPPLGSRVLVHYLTGIRNRAFYNDQEAFDVCCIQSGLCDLFFERRPTDDCSQYRPPSIRKL